MPIPGKTTIRLRAKNSVIPFHSASQCRQGHQACWCFECPRVVPVVEEADCLCPDCLRTEIAERTSPQEAPHPRSACDED